MPAKIMLPTNAKITAFVWRGRNRLNERYGAMFAGHHASWSATIAPTSMPTMPQPIDAITNARTTRSLYSTVLFSIVSTSALLVHGKELEPISVLERPLPGEPHEQADGRA